MCCASLAEIRYSLGMVLAAADATTLACSTARLFWVDHN